MRRPTCRHSHSSLHERRAEKRLLCSDLVQVRWRGAEGERREEIAIIEDVSPSGASLFMGVAIPKGAHVTILTPDMHTAGEVRHCATVGNGYSVGVRFTLAQRQGRELGYTPEHLLDVSRLDFQEP